MVEPGQALHGWIIIDKPIGPGSTNCVSAVKRALREGGYAKLKVGHGGTLDPLASGVLSIALGEATKLAGRMLDSDKAYAFAVTFGVATDTLDGEGREIAVSAIRPTRAAVLAVLARFTGPIDQVPPAYSAIKVDGRRAYARARAGEAVAMKTRGVTIHSLCLRPEFRHPSESWDLGEVGVAPAARDPSVRWGDEREAWGDDVEGLPHATFVAHVSKGTYIRSLARDIAEALGTVGHITMLRRLKAGPFDLTHAISLDKLADLAMSRALEDVILPLTAGLDDIPALPVSSDEAQALRQGRPAFGDHAHQGLSLAIHGDVPVALVEISGREVRVVRGFNL